MHLETIGVEHAFVESKRLLGSMKRKTSQGVSVFLKQKLAILIAKGSLEVYSRYLIYDEPTTVEQVIKDYKLNA